MRAVLIQFRFVLLVMLPFAVLSCEPPNKTPTTSPTFDVLLHASAMLHVNVHVGSKTGDDMYCSIEDHGQAAILVSELVSWNWNATNFDVNGKRSQYFSGHYDYRSKPELARYVILPSIAENQQDQPGRTGGEFLGFHFSLGDNDRSLASFTSGKIQLTLFVNASLDLSPKEYKVNVLINLPLKAGTNWTADVPIP